MSACIKTSTKVTKTYSTTVHHIINMNWTFTLTYAVYFQSKKIQQDLHQQDQREQQQNYVAKNFIIRRIKQIYQCQ